MMWYGDWGWGGWIMMTVVMVLFWGGLITAIVLGVRALTVGAGARHQSSPRVSPRAEDVLTERFARGEVDEDEFRRRMTALREHR